MRKALIIILTGIIFFGLSSSVDAGKAQGGDISLDIQPRSIPSTNAKATATIGIKIYPNEFVSFCKNESKVSYGLFRASTGTGDRATASWTATPTPNQIFEKTISVPLSSVKGGGWYALLYCGGIIQSANDIWVSGGQMSKTANVDIEVYNETNFTFGCVAADNKYACSPGEKPDCSDVTGACGGRACVKIQPKSLCNQAATANTYACDAGGTYACGTKSDCSDAVGCTAATRAACAKMDAALCGKPFGTAGATCGIPGKPACASGTDKSYPFKVPNWLSGEPKSLTDLLDTLARWLMNIAIPIAVLLIIYSGLIYVTSRGEAKKVQQATAILRAVVIGLVIIFIGKGFISLIRSIIELGVSS